MRGDDRELVDAKKLRLVCPVGSGQGRRCLPVVCQFNPTVRGGDIKVRGEVLPKFYSA